MSDHNSDPDRVLSDNQDQSEPIDLEHVENVDGDLDLDIDVDDDILEDRMIVDDVHSPPLQYEGDDDINLDYDNTPETESIDAVEGIDGALEYNVEDEDNIVELADNDDVYNDNEVYDIDAVSQEENDDIQNIGEDVDEDVDDVSEVISEDNSNDVHDNIQDDLHENVEEDVQDVEDDDQNENQDVNSQDDQKSAHEGDDFSKKNINDNEEVQNDSAPDQAQNQDNTDSREQHDISANQNNELLTEVAKSEEYNNEEIYQLEHDEDEVPQDDNVGDDIIDEKIIANQESEEVQADQVNIESRSPERQENVDADHQKLNQMQKNQAEQDAIQIDEGIDQDNQKNVVTDDLNPTVEISEVSDKPQLHPALETDNYNQNDESSFLNPNETYTSINPNVTFATPSKSLPFLKDIDTIVTPKSFQVARDIEPMIPEELLNNIPNEEHIIIISNFLNVDQNLLSNLNQQVLNSLVDRSKKFSLVESENAFNKLQLQQYQSKNEKKVHDLKTELEKLQEREQYYDTTSEELTTKVSQQSNELDQLKESNKHLQTRLNDLKDNDKELTSSLNKQKQEYHQEVAQLQSTISKLQLVNINQTTQINQLTRDLNDSKNSQFNLKLELIKETNSKTYLQNQKTWYEEELNSSQSKFTELSKKHDSEILITSNKLSNVTSKLESLESLNEQLKSTNEDLKEKLTKEISKISTTNSTHIAEKTKLISDLKGKQELLELTKRQADQRAERIEQLETYSRDLKLKLGDSIKSLQDTVTLKTEKIAELEEKLKRVEEVLDAELHKETDLPKLTTSSTLIAAEGISLSSLYSEFSHIKKQLVLERSQKEKLALQLQSFVEELESKKPAIANYREQIDYYERTVEQLISKVDSIRIEKLEAEKGANRLKSRFVSKENELISMKKLLKDLGRQLCYYLIHSNIRENHQDPLSNVEKKAIESILEKSGNFENQQDSDSDNLISERLVEFKSIVELKQRNEELLVAIRQLSKKLETKEEESNDMESIAVDEAKEAILTLQGELDSLFARYDAVSLERDSLKSISDMNGGNSSSEVKFLTDANSDLKSKLNESERILRDVQKQSKEYSDELNNKLQQANKTNTEISILLSQVKNAAKLAETKLLINEDTLNGTTVELKSLKREIDFWRNQAEKQEKLLVEQSNELREAESNLNKNKILFNSLNSEKHHNSNIVATLKEQVERLTVDKNTLNELLVNLQQLLKDREFANKELSENLAENSKNYYMLQQKLQEREDRAAVIASQTDLALKAQNAKLEQVNEISRQLLDTRALLAEKELALAQLNQKVKDFESMRKRAVVVEPSHTGDKVAADELNIEISQFKDDIRNLESSNAELINLLKAAESALMSSTTTNSEYKKTAEAKIDELTKIKTLLERELETSTKALNASKLELKKLVELNTVECNNLRTELQAVVGKATEFDNMKADYESRLNHVEEQARSQVQLSNTVQSKYEAELQKNQDSLENISKLKEEVTTLKAYLDQSRSELEKVKSEEQTRFEAFVGEKSDIDEELNANKQKLQELEEQNKLLLNQLDLSKSADTTGSEYELREVVAYLRREKESFEAKSVKAQELNSELQARLTQLTNELNVAKNEVDFVQSNYVNLNDGEKERKLLSEQVQQLNILRESNTTLRNEANQKLQVIADLEARLLQIQSKVDPLVSQINDLTTSIELANQKVSLLQEENEKLKTKTVSTASEDAANLIAARERLSTVREQANTKIKSQNAFIESLNVSIKNLQDEISKLKNAKSEDSSKIQTEYQKKIDDLTQTVSSTKAQLQLVEDEKKKLLEQAAQPKTNDEVKINELTDIFNKEKAELSSKLQKEFDGKLQTELSNVETSLSESIRKDITNEYEEKIKDLEKSFESTKEKLKEEIQKSRDDKLKQQSLENAKSSSNDDSSQLRADLKAEHQAEVAKLNEEFKKKLDEEVASAKAQVEKLFEVKIKFLTKKLDRFTNSDNKTSQSSSNNQSNATSSGFGSNLPNNSKTIVRNQNTNNQNTSNSTANNQSKQGNTKLNASNQNTNIPNSNQNNNNQQANNQNSEKNPQKRKARSHHYPRAESTLTVRMPEPLKKSNTGHNNDKKRPFSQTFPHQQAKKPKD